jgi:nucleotide-binding universal stress UspA family protein
MRDVKRLLVAIDLHRDATVLTAGSCIAMDHAVELSKRVGCRVLLLHAMEPGTTTEPEPFVAQGHLARAERVLEQEAARLHALGVEATAAVREGPACLAILDHVRSESIDLVLTGRRSERSHDAHRIGSVAMELLRKCPCPVWVAKLGGAATPHRVLAAIGRSPIGGRVIEYAAFVASAYSAELHVAHDGPLTERLADRIAPCQLATPAVFHALRGSAAQALLECAARVEADLVVMGTPDSSIARLFGSTAERVLSRLEVSLLAI